MILHTTQKIVAKDTHRFRVCCNGRRWGKTTLAIEEIKGCALSKDARIAYIAPTYQQARDIAWEALKRELDPIIINVNESRLELKVRNIKGGESIIILRGWESIETLRGQKLDFVVIDEVAMMRNFWENWEEVIRPTLTDNRGHGLFISTPKGFNHFYELFSKDPNQPEVEGVEKDDDYRSFHFTTSDNPHMPPDEIEKAQKELSETRFGQEYLADFRKVEGLVYKEFDRNKHLFTDYNDIPSSNLTFGGIDFGFTNPSVVVEITRDHDNNYWVMSEWYHREKTNTEVGEYARSLGLNAWYPDPAEPDRISELKKMGLNCKEVNKDVEKGIDTVQTLLRDGKLKIHVSCKHLIEEFETYSWKEKVAGRNDPDEPIKENDHALDALRYALYMQNPVRSMRREARQYVPKGIVRNVMQTKWIDQQY